MTVMLFATLRDYAGSKTVDLEVPEGTTVLEMKGILAQTYPRIGTVQHSIMTAINREFVADEQVIPLGAEIALFPPVSGG